MAGRSRAEPSWRSIGFGLPVVLMLGASLLLSGCGLLPVLPTQTVRPEASAQVQPTAAPVPTPRPSPTPPPPTPTLLPSPTPQPAVTAAEAESVVRAWFSALEAEDYLGMEVLTADNATLHTKALTDAIQLEAKRQSVDLDIVTQRLDVQPGARVRRGEAVDTDFEMDINALVGPFSFAARQILGTATFVVDRVNGEVKIIDIQNATGLPEAD